MKLKLNRYQIAGAILSVLWIVGAALYAHSDDVENANNFAQFADKVCADSVRIGTSMPENCQEEHAKNVAVWMNGDVGNVFFLAFAPLPVFWLAGFCLLYFFRAQVIGFRAVIPWNSLSWRKRAFVVFCIVCVVGSGLFGILIVLNAYVDSLEPVSPTLKSFYKAPDGSRVEIVGTWTRTDLADDTIADPIQTSRIVCIKSDNRCTEAKAYLYGNILFSDNNEYAVDSWTDTVIVLRNDNLCSTETYTIDLNTEVVSGAGHKTNDDQPYCKSSFNRDGSDHWTLQMEDGFKVYWTLRQKKRPWLLRVMQTFLGN